MPDPKASAASLRRLAERNRELAREARERASATRNEWGTDATMEQAAANDDQLAEQFEAQADSYDQQATYYEDGESDGNDDGGANLSVGTEVTVDDGTQGIVRRVDNGIYYIETADDQDALHRYSARELTPLTGSGTEHSDRNPAEQIGEAAEETEEAAVATANAGVAAGIPPEQMDEIVERTVTRLREAGVQVETAAAETEEVAETVSEVARESGNAEAVEEAEEAVEQAQEAGEAAEVAEEAVRDTVEPADEHWWYRRRGRKTAQ